jgi:membrane protease YdiL (CAAX protease family)
VNPITSFVKRYPQGVFWGIAYAIPWAAYVLDRIYPNDLWQLATWGIFLGGALVTGIADGRAGLKTYFSRLVRWRAGIQWYAIGVLMPFLLGLIAFGLTLLSGNVTQADIQFPEASQVVGVYILSFLFIALGEEPGIRGFSLPRFMNSRTAFAASLIVGILHAIWHLPLVIGGGLHPLDLLHPLCGAILLTWIFNHTNGSVFIIMLIHAASDTSPGFFGSMFTGTNEMLFTIWQAVAFVGMAVIIRVFAGPELGRKAQPETQMMAAGQATAAD